MGGAANVLKSKGASFSVDMNYPFATIKYLRTPSLF